MSAVRPSAPKSSLNAKRAAAAPWGLSPPTPSKPLQSSQSSQSSQGSQRLQTPKLSQPLRAPGIEPVRTTRSEQPRRTGSAQSRGSAKQHAVGGAARIRTASEQRVIALVVATAIGLMLALGLTGAQASHSASSARKRIGGTLGRASIEQMEFYSQHARFALWDELSARGMRLPDQVAVVASNASASHWYLRLRDVSTGVTCDRIGQLLDAPTGEVAPTCERVRQ